MTNYIAGGFCLVALRFLSYFSSTMYMVALPVIMMKLHSPAAFISWSFFSFMLGSLVAQLVAAPFSDYFSRRYTLTICLLGFMFGCLITAIAKTDSLFIIGRLMQGIGIGCVPGLANSIINDACTLKHSRDKNVATAKILATLGLIISWATSIGMIITASLVNDISWQAVFYFLMIFSGLILFVMMKILLHFDEHINPDKIDLKKTLRLYQEIFTNPKLLCYSGTFGLMLSILYIYLLLSSSILFHQHLSLIKIALLTLIPSTGYALGKLLNLLLPSYLKARHSLVIGPLIAVVFSLLAALACVEQESLAIILPLIGCLFMGIGSTSPLTIARIMALYPNNTTMASNAQIIILSACSLVITYLAIFFHIHSELSLTVFMSGICLAALFISALYSFMRSQEKHPSVIRIELGP